MTYRAHLTQSVVILALISAHRSHAAVECVADGVTDVGACLQAAIDKAQSSGHMQVALGNGTYLINSPLTVPSGVQLLGKGRGDAGYIGTVLRVGTAFPLNAAVVEMGTAGTQNVGVLVKGMTIDGQGRAAYALEDLYSGDRSRGEDLSLFNFTIAGLHVEGTGASGAGPFKDLEIYPLEFATVTTNCILVHSVPVFLGVDGATCNAGNSSGLRPNVAVQMDGNGVYSDIHVESYVMGYQLGSATTAVDGIVVRNGQLGPRVDTGLTITSLAANQDIALFGISCYSCSVTLNDLVTGNSQYWPVGWYLEGSGMPLSNRRVFSSNAGTANNLGDHPVASVKNSPMLLRPNSNTARPYSHLRAPLRLNDSPE
jgi:hypothetical protein